MTAKCCKNIRHVLSKGVQKYFMDTYGRETHFIPNGVNRPQMERIFPLLGVRFISVKQAEHVLEILHERERKALICFSALERQEEKLSAEKAEIVKQRIALYEQYADGNISKEEFVRQRDAYRAQEDEKMEQIQRLRTEKNQALR